MLTGILNHGSPEGKIVANPRYGHFALFPNQIALGGKNVRLCLVTGIVLRIVAPHGKCEWSLLAVLCRELQFEAVNVLAGRSELYGLGGCVIGISVHQTKL